MGAILINAKAGHGKDTYRQYLIEALRQKKLNGKRMAFADILKDFTDDLYQRLKKYFKPQYQYDKIDNSLKNSQDSMQFRRRWWLAIGTYVKKYFGGLTWVESLMGQKFQEQFFYYPGCSQNFAVITDMRFQNQHKFVTAHRHRDKIMMIRIWRPGDHPIAGYMGTSEAFVNDKSETDLDSIIHDKWDRFVINDGDLQKLKKDAYDFVDILVTKI